jgi:16S rRNA (adenine1518-N6/adenine1519-N6)-dimethyltransferase
MSVLSVACQTYARVTLVASVPPGAFSPPPRVRSSVVRLDLFAPPPLAERVIALAKIGFQNRRKQLHKNLAGAPLPGGGRVDSDQVKRALVRLRLPVTARAQELSLEDWASLFSLLYCP